MCFWPCLALSIDIEVRNDRLVKKANNLFEDYYKSKPADSYGGFDIAELENVESYFNLHLIKTCRNGTGFNSKVSKCY